MYVLIDKTNGKVLEIINDTECYVASSNYEKIYLAFYPSNRNDITSVSCAFVNSENGQATSTVSSTPSTDTIPNGIKRDLQYFVEGQEYNFYVATLPTQTIGGTTFRVAGLCKATYTFTLSGTSTMASSVIPFVIQDSAIAPYNSITYPQYLYLKDLIDTQTNRVIYSSIDPTTIASLTNYEVGSIIVWHDTTNSVIKFYKVVVSGSSKSASQILPYTEWGKIGGTLSNQTDLQNALNSKLPRVNDSEKIDDVYSAFGSNKIFTYDDYLIKLTKDNTYYTAEVFTYADGELETVEHDYPVSLGATNTIFDLIDDIDTEEWSSVVFSSLEDVANKITSISSSSSDTEYPSAKAVYNSLEAIKSWTASSNQTITGLKKYSTLPESSEEYSYTSDRQLTDKQYVDTEISGVEQSVSDLSSSTTASLATKVDKTTTVNGHALSSNVTVTKTDVELGNVTNDAQVKRTEMGVASGVATLDSNAKVPTSQLPDNILGQLVYGGTINVIDSDATATEFDIIAKGFVSCSDNLLTLYGSAGSSSITIDGITVTDMSHGDRYVKYVDLINSIAGKAQAKGYYFIINAHWTSSSSYIQFANVKLKQVIRNTTYSSNDNCTTGDWLVISSTYTSPVKFAHFDKIDNTDAVSSVNGKTGAVVLSGTDINYDANTTLNAKIDTIDTNVTNITNGTTHLSASQIDYDSTNVDDMLDDIISGDQVVGESTKASQDANGNNIYSTYQPKILHVDLTILPSEWSNNTYTSANVYSTLGVVSSGDTILATAISDTDQTYIETYRVKVTDVSTTGTVTTITATCQTVPEHNISLRISLIKEYVAAGQTTGVLTTDDVDDNTIKFVNSKLTVNTDVIQSKLTFDSAPTSASTNPVTSGGVYTSLGNKQDTLVSGTNIKTINSTSLLGSGDIAITKTDVGLGNVDNTSDTNKPISTATQTALDLKANLSGGNTFSGTQVFNGDLNLSGSLTNGTNSISIANIANKNDLIRNIGYDIFTSGQYVSLNSIPNGFLIVRISGSFDGFTNYYSFTIPWISAPAESCICTSGNGYLYINSAGNLFLNWNGAIYSGTDIYWYITRINKF